MDLTFSTSDTETFLFGEEIVSNWKSLYRRDPILECLDHPVVAFDGELPVGLFEVSYDYFEDVMWLDSLWVHPEKRHQKYGTAILEYLVDTCQYSKIKLYAANHSGPFYAKNNFKATHGRYFQREIDE